MENSESLGTGSLITDSIFVFNTLSLSIVANYFKDVNVILSFITGIGSIITFICFLLINYKKIYEGVKEIISLSKTKDS